MDAAPPQLQTFCGFEEGQTEANLSNKDLGPGDAVLLAWELTTGFVSASLTKLKLANLELPIAGLKTEAEINLSNKNLTPLDVVVIATCMNVNASMTSVNLANNTLTGQYGKDMTGVNEIAAALSVSSMTSLK